MLENTAADVTKTDDDADMAEDGDGLLLLTWHALLTWCWCGDDISLTLPGELKFVERDSGFLDLLLAPLSLAGEDLECRGGVGLGC